MFKDHPQINWLPDGQRLNMRHGPIDLIVSAAGPDRDRALSQAAKAFPSVLTGLAGELDLLRRPVKINGPVPLGKIARAMWQAARNHRPEQFVTPMIAVAGAVADHLLAAMRMGTNLHRASVNNGGDIALYLDTGQSFDLAICANPLAGEIASRATIHHRDKVGGIATSGWRGRSHSLGIADAVTVFADNAASADTAATLIANGVDLPGHPAILRQPANELSPDSDLGDRPVTIDVNNLSSHDVRQALSRGEAVARSMIDRGLILAAFLALQSQVRIVSAESKYQTSGMSDIPAQEALHA